MKNLKICVVGLGYVGLPIYLKLRNYFYTLGFDSNLKRIKSLKKGIDLNKEFNKSQIFNKKKNIFTNRDIDLKSANFFIICVPTPIYENKKPDLRLLEKACKLIGKNLKKNDIIFFESTVYPGVTNDICKKILENTSKLKAKKDFLIGYSPERINPGDKKREIQKIKKIVAVDTSNKDKIILVKKIFSKISKKIIFTKSIESAETAKVIENIQRDLNIGLFNEIFKVCEKLNINFSEVIELASTKWNFIKYKPGLVGGHCLPVDPYYLSYISKKKGLKMDILLSGRKVNNGMEQYIFEKISRVLKEKKINKNDKILILGETYKPNVADKRNSLASKIIKKIVQIYKKTELYDPFTDIQKINKNYKIKNFEIKRRYKVIVELVEHSLFKNLIKNYLKKNVNTFYLNPFK